ERFVAAAAISRSDKRQIWTRALDGLAFQPVVGTENGLFPFWSPDGHWIGFNTPHGLKKVPASGGEPVAICDTSSEGVQAEWTRDGIIVYSERNAFFRVSANGGPPVPITIHPPNEEDRQRLFRSMLPDGRHFLYLSTNMLGGDAGTVNVASLDSGAVTPILS